MVTLTIPFHRKSTEVHEGHGHSLAGDIAAFYGWLTGPGMTERDRRYRDIAETRFQRYLGPTGF